MMRGFRIFLIFTLIPNFDDSAGRSRVPKDVVGRG